MVCYKRYKFITRINKDEIVITCYVVPDDKK